MVGKTAIYDSSKFAIHAGYLVRVRLLKPTDFHYANFVKKLLWVLIETRTRAVLMFIDEHWMHWCDPFGVDYFLV
jgi:hypothetical protein